MGGDGGAAAELGAYWGMGGKLPIPQEFWIGFDCLLNTLAYSG
jgi:hypothetical protein